jgi:hypothetical protein
MESISLSWSGSMRLRSTILLLVVILVLSLVMNPEFVSAQWDYEEYPIGDTFIDQSFPNDNHGADPFGMWVLWDGTDRAQRILLEFDLSSIPPGSIITDARLSLRSGGYYGSGTRTFTVHRVSNSWVEGDGIGMGGGTIGATWLDADKSVPTSWSTQGGNFVSEGASSTDLTLGFGRRNFTVTDIVTAWVTDGQSNYGFLIKVDNEAGAGAGFYFRVREYDSLIDRPILQINWEAPPEDATPVGGLTMSANNLRILTPYIALAGLIAVVSSVYVIKKRKD